MGLFDNFPYTNFHELNLDWVLKVLKDIETTIDQFVSLNIIKYADPIQWDITRQYPKNTIVIDPISGTAYISVDNVPQGVALSNTDYWSVVFDLGRFITLAAQNFAVSYEPVLTTTATMPTIEGGWIVWNSLLYEALNDIHVGDRYVEDGNIKKTPVEVFFNRLKAELNTEILDRIAADNALGGRIDQEILDRQAADNALGGRIDQEILDRIAADNALGGRIDQEILDRQAAINNVIDIIDSKYVYTTIDNMINSSNLVLGSVIEITGVTGKFIVKNTHDNARLYYTLANGLYAVYIPAGIVDFLAWNVDRDLDCSSQLQNAIRLAKDVRLPLVITGRYTLSSPVETWRSVRITGHNGAMLFCYNFNVDQTPILQIHGRDVNEQDSAYDNSTSPVVLENISFYGHNSEPNTFPSTDGFNVSNCLYIDAFHLCINNVVIRGFNRAVTNGNNTYVIEFNDCRFFYNNVALFLDGVNTTNSGGLMLLNNCSLANCRYAIWNRMWNISLINCNLNFNYRHAVSQNSVGGITSCSEMYTNCEFEESENSYGHMFENFGSDYANWTFNSCMFYMASNVDDGYFNLLSGGSQIRFKNSWIRTFGEPTALRQPNKYLIHTAGNKGIVDLDIRPFVIGNEGDIFRMAKVENICDTNTKGFTTSNCTVSYGNDVITITNNSDNYAHVTKNIKLNRAGRYLNSSVKLTSSVSGTRPCINFYFKNDANETLAVHSPSITLSSGNDEIFVTSANIPDDATNVDIDFTTVTSAQNVSLTVAGFYLYQQL